MANWAKLQEDTHDMPVHKRARHGIHFKRSDGQIQAEFVGKPCHYLDGGVWKPIDTKLLALGDGYYGCPHSKVKVHPDGTVAVVGTDYVQRVELPSAQTGLVDNDVLVRKFSFGEQRLWVTETGFKSEIILNRIPTLTEARKLVASESGTLSKEYIKSLTTATDANGNSHAFSTLSAFRTWLAQASFPVVIDPDFTGSTADGSIISQSTNYTTAHTQGAVNTTAETSSIGQRIQPATYYRCGRVYLLFDTSSIGGGSSVTQVNLVIDGYSDSSTQDFNVLICKQDWSAGLDNTRFVATLTADLDDGDFGNTSAGWSGAKTSGNLSTTWVSKTGTTYYSIISDRDRAGTQPSADEIVATSMANRAIESARPKLTVTYTAGGSPHYMSLLGVGS